MMLDHHPGEVSSGGEVEEEDEDEAGEGDTEPSGRVQFPCLLSAVKCKCFRNSSVRVCICVSL